MHRLIFIYTEECPASIPVRWLPSFGKSVTEFAFHLYGGGQSSRRDATEEDNASDLLLTNMCKKGRPKVILKDFLAMTTFPNYTSSVAGVLSNKSTQVPDVMNHWMWSQLSITYHVLDHLGRHSMQLLVHIYSSSCSRPC